MILQMTGSAVIIGDSETYYLNMSILTIKAITNRMISSHFLVELTRKIGNAKTLVNGRFELGPSTILKVFYKTVFLKDLKNRRFELGPSTIL